MFTWELFGVDYKWIIVKIEDDEEEEEAKVSRQWKSKRKFNEKIRTGKRKKKSEKKKVYGNKKKKIR